MVEQKQQAAKLKLNAHVDLPACSGLSVMQAARLARLLGSSIDDGVDFTCLINSPSKDAKAYKEVKFPDAIYRNYYSLGLSICYEPSAGSSTYALSHIDTYNAPADSAPKRSRRKEAWAGYSSPPFPLEFHFATTSVPTLGQAPSPSCNSRTTDSQTNPLERSLNFPVDAKTTGKDFVRHFGEPTKKSAGEPGYVPPFLEWASVDILDENEEKTRVGVMLELRDPGVQEGVSGGNAGEKQGAGIWDRAGDWGWTSLKLFKPDQTT